MRRVVEVCRTAWQPLPNLKGEAWARCALARLILLFSTFALYCLLLLLLILLTAIHG